MLKIIPTLTLLLGLSGTVTSISLDLFDLEFSLLYLSGLSIFLLMYVTKFGWFRIQKILIDIASLLGIFLIYLICRSTLLRDLPGWDPTSGLIDLALSTLLMGSFITLYLLGSRGGFSSQKALSIMSAVLIFGLMALIPFHLARADSLVLPTNLAMVSFLSVNAWLFFVRIGLLLGLLILLFRITYLIRSDNQNCKKIFIPLSIGLVLLLGAEITNRCLLVMSAH